MDLGNPKNTIEVIQKYNFAFQKKFGQNFLIDTHVLDKIISAAGMTKEDTVLEVGPGIGTMTQRLSQAAGQVIAVEIDTNLIPILKDTLQDCENVTVINEDILKIDIKKMAEEKGGGRPVKVVANLPYYITTPIIMGLFESGAPIDNITVMVQKEVADRMQVGPGSKDYGALSLAVQYYAEPYIVANVPPNCFIPRPNVGSAVIRLTRHAKPPVEVKDKDLMFRLIRASFNQRRKTLQNGLSNAQDLSFSKEEIAAAIESLGLSPSVRGETLSLTRKETGILEYLLLHQGRPVSQEELLEHVWDSGADGFGNSIRVHISALRKKLRAALGYDPIRNRIGEGYVMEAQT